MGEANENQPSSISLGCVTGEDKVVSFLLRVAGEAGLHERRVGRFAVRVEVTETPTASRGVLY